MDKIKVVIIAAMSKHTRVIAYKGGLPYELPADMAHFRRTTINGVVLMGSGTFISLGSIPLPKRTNIVITSKPKEFMDAYYDRVPDNLTAVGSLREGIRKAKAHAVIKDLDTCYVIGGESVYNQAIHYADELLITEIDYDYPGDKWFPNIDPILWVKADVQSFDVSLGYAAYQIVRYVRRP